jgi:hypothetical protein
MDRRCSLAAALAMSALIGSGLWQGRAAAADGPPAAMESAHEEMAGAGPAEAPVLENDQVRVVRMHLGPHQKIPMHQPPPHLVVWLTPAHLQMTFPDGKSVQAHFSRGQVTWVAAQKHAGENLGERPVDFLAIFVKNAGAGAPLAH